MTDFRKAGAELLRVIESSSDPAAVPGQVQVYAKDSSGTTKLFMRDSGGNVQEVGTGGGGNFAPPEQWTAVAIAASQTNATMSAQVDTTTDTTMMIRAGNVSGLSVKLSAAVATGTVTVRITKNGTPGTLQLVISAGQSFGHVTQVAPSDAYVADDLIGLVYSTSGDFTPAGSVDVEAWIQLTEEGVVPGAGVPLSRQINAGTGLQGGGDLSTDRTLSLADTAVTPGSYTSANITVDQQGRITAAASGGVGGSAVAIQKSALAAGTYNLTTTPGVVDWLIHTSGGFIPSNTPARAQAYGTSGPVVKRNGTKEILNGYDWFTTGTNVTFQANGTFGGGRTLQTNTGDVSYPYAGQSTSTAYGYNAGDGINFGFAVSIPSASFERRLRCYLGVSEITMGITAILADGTTASDTIVVAAETNEAHQVDIVWTGGGNMVVRFNVNSQSSASGGGIYVFGFALL